MAKLYTIVRGTFRESDGSLKVAGQVIELEDDVAASHTDRIEPVDLESATAPAVTGGPDGGEADQ